MKLLLSFNISCNVNWCLFSAIISSKDEQMITSQNFERDFQIKSNKAYGDYWMG